MKSPAFSKTIALELFSVPTITWTVLFALVYLFSVQIFLNYKLLVFAFSSHYSLYSIFNLLSSLFVGSFTSMNAEPTTLFLIVLNALLVGLNILLLGKAILWLGHQKKVHLSLGGATLFALVTAGCASCGLSLVSVLGLSATLAFLPFHGAELRVIAIILLLISTFYVLKNLHEAKYCKI